MIARLKRNLRLDWLLRDRPFAAKAHTKARTKSGYVRMRDMCYHIVPMLTHEHLAFRLTPKQPLQKLSTTRILMIRIDSARLYVDNKSASLYVRIRMSILNACVSARHAWSRGARTTYALAYVHSRRSHSHAPFHIFWW